MLIKLIFLFILSALYVTPPVVASKALQMPDKQGYIGQKACAECHQKQSIQWSGSHHDRSMQEATPDTVLGDFNQVDFSHQGVTSTFYKINNQYWVKTDGPEGKLDVFRIAYTFGVYPLQQYLIKMSDGRLQALDIVWDSRDSGQGGQRWYALHPDEVIHHDDVLHWTGPNLNWNYMCADCHSTHLQKNYDADTGMYKTQWSEIDVSCEACHGPGQAHQQWAKSISDKSDNQSLSESENTIPENSIHQDKGLSVVLNERKDVIWSINPESRKPFRSVPRLSQNEIDTCARCHSRRTQFSQPQPADNPGEQFLDNFRPALLTPGLYHADGQIQDEVYVYGSFLQSKMYQAGVTCSDCHDPHLAGLKLPGDRVCNQCHEPEQYQTQKHHFHPASAKTSCLDCHMPVTTYMGVDQRHDHSFRIPRPDLSQSLDTPNVCLKCHDEKSSPQASKQWAAEQIDNWYGDKKSGLQQYAAIIAAQRDQLPQSNQMAIQLLLDSTQPVIARATVLSQISDLINNEAFLVIKEQLQHDKALLRSAALMALSTLTESGKLEFELAAETAFPMLEDPVRLVRIEAARVLAPLDESQFATDDQKKLQKARQEYIDSLLFNAERPESQFNLGNFYFQSEDYPNTEKAYRKALALQTKFIPAWINLAQFYSEMNRDEDAVQTLKRGLEQISESESADIYYAMGLAQVRLNQLSEAIVSLAKSAQLAPENPHYSYIYGIALNSYQRPEEAIDVLQQAHIAHPQNYEILTALLTINQDNGNNKAALNYAQKILAIAPDDQSIKDLIEQLNALLQ